MFKNRFSRIGLAAAAACAALLAGGSAYAAARSAGLISATATDTIAVHTSSVIYLPSAGGAETPIVSMNLPAGMWVLGASGDFVNSGASDYVRCQIVVDGTQIAATSTVVGNPNLGFLFGAGAVGPAGLDSTVTLAGAVTVGGAGATATLQCEHDTGNGYQPPSFDSGGSMWAHQTKSLSVQSF